MTENNNNTIRLLDHEPVGQTVQVVRVMGDGAFRLRLLEMGFVRGAKVTVLKNAPLRDPVEYMIMGSHISLRHSEAAQVEVTDRDAEFCDMEDAYQGIVETEVAAVDPMADKYPSMSPYSYCAWNPMKLVDPDGREVINAHTKKVGELQKKIANLQNQINNCNDKKQLRSLNKRLNKLQSSLKEEIRYEKSVNEAIQNLKDYGGDEFNQLDNLKNIYGEKIDVYIQMKSEIGGVKKPKCGNTEMILSQDGNCRSEKGANSVVISLSDKFKSVLGKTLAHEGGHAIFNVTNPDAVLRFMSEHPTAIQDGHDQGNPSGLFADKCESEYSQRKKR